METKIMKPADICTTLRLPTCVKASKPAFSLQTLKQKYLERFEIRAIDQTIKILASKETKKRRTRTSVFSRH